MISRMLLNVCEVADRACNGPLGHVAEASISQRFTSRIGVVESGSDIDEVSEHPEQPIHLIDIDPSRQFGHPRTPSHVHRHLDGALSISPSALHFDGDL